MTQDEKYRRYAHEAQEQAQRSRNASDKVSRTGFGEFSY
jgi:hypothetical protein